MTIGKKPEIVNLSGKPQNVSFDTKALKKIVFFPNVWPGKGILPTGTMAVYGNGHHICGDYIGSDIGCGVLLARFRYPPADYLKDTTNKIAAAMFEGRELLGGLSGGSECHFITIYESIDTSSSQINYGEYSVLIHTGSMSIGRDVFESRLTGADYLREHDEAVVYAKRNRKEILKRIEEAAGIRTDIIFDRIHNYVTIEGSSVVYRKGSVRLMPGELGVISSSMEGDALVVTPRTLLKDLEWTINHSTGRKMSRNEASGKEFYLENTGSDVYLPYWMSREHITTELPQCYHTLGDVMPLISDYFDVVGRLRPKSTIMD